MVLLLLLLTDEMGLGKTVQVEYKGEISMMMMIGS